MVEVEAEPILQTGIDAVGTYWQDQDIRAKRLLEMAVYVSLEQDDERARDIR